MIPDLLILGRTSHSTYANVVYPLESILPPLPGLGLNCSP
jgi:hypothetical protein